MTEQPSVGKSTTTIRDIARVANVSISTVSRVLNDHPHVDEDTRQSVWKIVSELDYPMSRVRGQTARNTHTIAFISNGIRGNAQKTVSVNVSGIEQLIVSGAQTIFHQQQISTHIFKSNITVENINNLIVSNAIDGLIFLGGIYKPDILSWLLEEKTPFIAAGAHAYPLNVTSVMANYMQGMELAVEHLVELGHKRICLVNGPNTTNTSEEKYKGLRLSLSLHGLPYDPYQVTEGNWFDSEGGYVATLRLLAQSRQIDAIIYADDGMALGGLKALREARRLVPDDVAVIGFHNYEYAKYADPALTTIGFDMEMMGRLAAQRLIALMNGEQRDFHLMTVPTTLIVREST